MDEVKQVAVPDSPEARRLALLGGYHADLMEAEGTLDLAETFTSDTDQRGSDIYRCLVAHAVIAYARCFVNSKVRESLSTILSVPSAYEDAHRAMMVMRNRTVAHSESALQVTYAVVDLRHVEQETTVDRALSITFGTGIPRPVVEQVRLLITELRAALQVHFDAAKAALVASLDETAVEDLWVNGKQPCLVPTSNSQWSADTRRAEYPASTETPIYVGWLPSEEQDQQ